MRHSGGNAQKIRVSLSQGRKSNYGRGRSILEETSSPTERTEKSRQLSLTTEPSTTERCEQLV